MILMHWAQVHTQPGVRPLAQTKGRPMLRPRGRALWVRTAWESFRDEDGGLELSPEALGGLRCVGRGRQDLPREEGSWGLLVPKPCPE